ncbi:unannotated protein [freshwater metagenome]|uniref:Unannotated protein n=1 Tax=freshwater metagenome TaxID=449393 RepID=A0A6J7KSY0_9ZZZZ
MTAPPTLTPKIFANARTSLQIVVSSNARETTSAETLRILKPIFSAWATKESASTFETVTVSKVLAFTTPPAAAIEARSASANPCMRSAIALNP